MAEAPLETIPGRDGIRIPTISNEYLLDYKVPHFFRNLFLANGRDLGLDPEPGNDRHPGFNHIITALPRGEKPLVVVQDIRKPGLRSPDPKFPHDEWFRDATETYTVAVPISPLELLKLVEVKYVDRGHVRWNYDVEVDQWPGISDIPPLPQSAPSTPEESIGEYPRRLEDWNEASHRRVLNGITQLLR